MSGSAATATNVGSSAQKKVDVVKVVSPQVIWYDRGAKHSQFNHPVTLISTREECLKTINQSSLPIFLIANSQHATEILSDIHPLEQIDTIFLICSSAREKQRCDYLRQHYSKIFDLFVSDEDLFETIQQWTTLYERHSGNDYLRLGEEYQKKNDWNRALQYTHRALIVYQRTLSNTNHPLIARCFNNLGAIYDAQSDVNRSFEYYEKAVQIYGKLTPKVPPQQNPQPKKKQ